MDREPQTDATLEPAAAAAAGPGAGHQAAQPPVPGPALARPATMSRNGRLVNAALGAAVVVAIAGVAFAVGRLTAPAAALLGGPDGRPGIVFDGSGPDGPTGSGGPAAFGGAGPTIEGTVESVTDSTLTIKTDAGQTMEIALDDTTTYHAQSDASADDVVTGGRVLVRVALPRGQSVGGADAPSASDVTVVP